MIDRLGRKPLYLIGSCGMAAVLFLLALAVVTGHFQGLLVLILILVYLAFFCSCIGPVFWTLLPEMFPNSIRGTALTIPVLTQWVANAFVVLLFLWSLTALGRQLRLASWAHWHWRKQFLHGASYRRLRTDLWKRLRLSGKPRQSVPKLSLAKLCEYYSGAIRRRFSLG